jgi:thioredoxin 1
VVVKYFANWCGSCKLFAPKYKRVSNEEQYSTITFLDVNAEENPQARRAAQVDNLPYLAVFKNGKLVEGSASSKEDYLRKLIEKATEA